MLRAQTRKLQLAHDIDFEQIEAQVPKNFTGADFYGLTSQTLLHALRKKIAGLQALYDEARSGTENLNFNSFMAQLIADDPAKAVTVITTEDFLAAVQKQQPSVTEKELQSYLELEKKYSAAEN